MGVIVRVERIHGGSTQSLVRRGSRGAVVDKVHLGHRRGRLTVAHKAVRAVAVRSRLPDVVRRGGGDNHVRAFGLEEVGGIDEILRVGEDGFGNAARRRKRVG